MSEVHEPVAAPIGGDVGTRRRLARMLRDEEPTVLRTWERAVGELAKGKGLRPAELRDHLPALLRRLATVVDPDAAATGPSGPEPHLHALQRLEQGYDLELLVREFSTLRRCLLRRWSELGEAPDGVALLHRVIDEAIAVAVQDFTAARQRLLVALDRISATALESDDLEGILVAMSSALRDSDPSVDSVDVMLLADDGRLHTRATVGLDRGLVAGFSLAVGEGFAGAVAARREPMELRDASRSGLVRSEALRAARPRTLYGVPLIHDRELVGVAIMGSTTAAEFSTEDKVLFRSMTERATVGIAQQQLRRALRVEHDRSESERRRLEGVLELIPVGVVIADRRGRMVAANPALRRIWGIPEWEAGHGIDYYGRFRARWAKSGEPLRAEDWGLARALLRGETSSGEELWIEAFDGERKAILHAAAPLRDEDGSLLGAVSTTVDITERRRHEDEWQLLADVGGALAASFEDEALVEVARILVPRLADGCAIDLLDPETGRAKRVACEHRVPEKRALAEHITVRWSPTLGDEGGSGWVIAKGRARLVRITDERLARHAADEAHLEALRRLGFHSYIAVPLVAQGRVVGALLLFDDTGARAFGPADVRFAQEVGDRIAQAVASARLYRDAQEAIAARDELWAVASHELKNPLAALLLTLQTAVRSLGPEPGPIGDKLRRAEGQTKRLVSLTSELLETTKAKAGRLELKPEPLDLAALVAELGDKHRVEAERAGSALTVEARRPVVGRWDRVRLEQVVTNLLTNAIKYGGGKPIRLEASEDGPWAIVRVRDQGIGIPPEARRSLFRPFERVGGTQKRGTGLGLYIVRQIVEAHGGAISLESEPGRGSTFTVRLPSSPPERDRRRADEETKGAGRG